MCDTGKQSLVSLYSRVPSFGSRIFVRDFVWILLSFAKTRQQKELCCGLCEEQLSNVDLGLWSRTCCIMGSFWAPGTVQGLELKSIQEVESSVFVPLRLMQH